MATGGNELNEAQLTIHSKTSDICKYSNMNAEKRYKYTATATGDLIFSIKLFTKQAKNL